MRATVKKGSIAALAAALATLPATLVRDARAGEIIATAKDGGAIYAVTCAACHLLKGEGAVGAGRYPALAGDSKLEFAPYPISIVLDGHGAMPPFKDVLDDAQIAAVLNYVRGPALRNHYATPISEADVRQARR